MVSRTRSPARTVWQVMLGAHHGVGRRLVVARALAPGSEMMARRPTPAAGRRAAARTQVERQQDMPELTLVISEGTGLFRVSKLSRPPTKTERNGEVLLVTHAWAGGSSVIGPPLGPHSVPTSAAQSVGSILHARFTSDGPGDPGSGR